MKIRYAENRGTAEVPFGFVYFDDETRVLYADIEGALLVEPHEGPYWTPSGPRHVAAAQEFLIEQFPEKVLA